MKLYKMALILLLVFNMSPKVFAGTLGNGYMGNPLGGPPLSAKEITEINRNKKLIVGAWTCNETRIDPDRDDSGNYITKNGRKTYGDNVTNIKEGTGEFVMTFNNNGRISTGLWAGKLYKFAVYDNGKDFAIGVYFPRSMSFGIERERAYYPSSGERIIYDGHKIEILTATELEFSWINDVWYTMKYYKCKKLSKKGN